MRDDAVLGFTSNNNIQYIQYAQHQLTVYEVPRRHILSQYTDRVMHIIHTGISEDNTHVRT